MSEQVNQGNTVYAVGDLVDFSYQGVGGSGRIIDITTGTYYCIQVEDLTEGEWSFLHTCNTRLATRCGWNVPKHFLTKRGPCYPVLNKLL